ncbi:MAG: peptidoglycan D,D-transpeptidase FtsI family protein [Methylococcaceae bacterium]
MIVFPVKSKITKSIGGFSGRRRFLTGFMLACMVILVGRAIYLQILDKKHLKAEGSARQVGEVSVSAYRGMIKDRNGAPLAVSTAVESISINPKELGSKDLTKDEKLRIKKLESELKKTQKKLLTNEQKAKVLFDYKTDKAEKIARMESLLDLPKGKIIALIKENPDRQFASIARSIEPGLASQVKELDLLGVYSEREFKRFYPTASVSAHLVGFTDAEDVGQEGMEAGYEQLLKGAPGKKRVLRDGQRRIIDDVENIREPIPGKDLELSIDQRIQYLAYRELQLAVAENKAKSAALVILDAKNGEILAAVNQPSFNPNVRSELKENLYRNRALTDVFEPGSTVKPFVVAAALDGHYVRPNDVFQTHGFLQIGHHTVKDVHNYGALDLTGVLKKSSNVAVSQMALKMPPKYFWGIYHQLGFGTSAGSGFKGEASGSLLDYHRWKDFDKATLSFGYGVSTSALQLARAYTALADDGILHSVSILKRDEDIDAKRVFSTKTARSVRAMMEHVVMKDGTAYEARVDGYTVAGKTGTVKKAGAHGYTEKRYFSVFAGMIPAKDPRLVAVIMIDEPSAGKYYGGLVSAPVFSKVMTGAMRILEVSPDQQETMPVLLTQKNP